MVAYRGVLILAAVALVLWIRTRPLSLGAVAPAERSQLTYAGADGHEHVYLGDYDSYYWLRAARTALSSGTVCDRLVGTECRDDHAHAPFGGVGKYERSLHVASIVWVQRLMTWLRPGFPLPTSAFLVPVLVGALGVLPAFAIGRRLAGTVSGLLAALLIAVNPLFLVRSIGSDNDVWNVVLPLYLMWAAMRAADARTLWKQALYVLFGLVTIRLQAQTWNGWIFTYAVVLGGLFIDLAITALQAAVDHQPVWRAPVPRRVAVALAGFCLAPLVLLDVSGADPASLLAALQPVGEIFRSVPAGPGAGASAQWPESFAAVAELARPDLQRISGVIADVPTFFIAWLGLLVLLLPRRGWQWWHFALLIGGNYLYAYLVTRPNPGRPLLLVLLALPLAAAILISLLDRDRTETADRSANILVVGWFLAALFLAFDGLRFIMLLVPAFGIAFGVAIGRSCTWLVDAVPRPPAPRWVAAVLPFVVAAGALVQPVYRAYGVANTYVPGMNDAWWDTLGRIRDAAPPETILSTWWPYGYWAEYVADRRTSIDGGSLPSHAPFWLARVLLAPREDEAVGLLRMMDCGSDFHPTGDNDVGAYERIVRQHVDGLAAQSAVEEIARRDRADAQAYVRAMGIAEPAQRQILAVTHCDPPPAFLILTTDMLEARGWKYAGAWSVRNAYVAGQLRGRPEPEAIADITTRFGLPEDDARALYRTATQLTTDAARDDFVSPHQSYLTKTWVPCEPTPDGQTLTCPLNLRLPSRGGTLEAFVYPRHAPSSGRFRWRPANAPPRDAAPATVIVAGPQQLDDVAAADPIDPTLAVLVDLPKDRVLVGTVALLRSTFTHLMFLDGRYARSFRKFDERRGYRGERVVAWAVDWTAAARPPEAAGGNPSDSQ